MHTIFVLLLALFCFLMFVVSRPTKMGILLVAGICIYEYHLNFGTGALKDFGNCVIILPLCFCISELNSFFNLFRNVRYTILYFFFIMGLLYVLFSIYVSPYMGTGIKYLIIAMATRYMLPFYALFCIRNKEDINKIYRIVFVGILVMTSFGIFNYATKHSFYVDWLLEGSSVADYLSEAGSKFTHVERFRVQATFSNPFDYGYTCLALLLFYWYGYIKKYVSSNKMIIVVGCSLFGIVCCNCRTILLCSMVVLMCFAILSFKSSKYMKYLVLLITLGVLGVNMIPFLSEKTAFLATMLDADSNKVEGSSINMRSIQLLTVMSYIQGHELTGNGIGFFAKNSNLSIKGSKMADEALGGLEGSYLQTLLETGIIGTIFYFGLILVVLLWALRKRRKEKLPASFLFSLFFFFFFFGVLTGELRSAYITFLLGGFAMYEIFNGNIQKNYYSKTHNVQQP